MNYSDSIYCLGRGVAGLRPQGISREWLRYFLQYSAQDFNNAGTGTTFKQIDKKTLENWTFPLPPLNEQKRIVAKIEALNTHSRKAREALEEIPALLDQFRQSVLAAAFRGDLTADWREQNPDVEPASVLLERIRADRRQKWEAAELEKMLSQGKIVTNSNWKNKYKDIDIKNSKILSTLPDFWCWMPVEMISTKVVDGVHKKPNYVDTGIPFVTVRNLTAGSGISFEKLNYITLETIAATILEKLQTAMEEMQSLQELLESP